MLGLCFLGLFCITIIQTLRIIYLKKKIEKQALKEHLLTQIIEERCTPYEEKGSNNL